MEPLYLPFISCQLAFCPVIYLSIHILFVTIRPVICFFLFRYFISISTLFFRSSFVRPPDCRNKIFHLSIKCIVFISSRSPATPVLLSARLRFLQLLFLPRDTARVNTFSSSLSRVIDQRGGITRGERRDLQTRRA